MYVGEKNPLVVVLAAYGDLAAGEDLGGQDGRDAAEADGLALAVEGLEHRLHLLVDTAVLPLGGPRAQVLGCAEATCKTDRATKTFR